MKRIYTILCIPLICCAHICAQVVPVEDYLQQAGVYAEIYNGKIEESYNTVLYKNLPYYINSDFTEASIVYKNNYYPHQKARLDLYREQLAVVPPGTQLAVVLGSSNIEKVYMHGKTFVWLTPSKAGGLKPGYYMLLSEGAKTQLFCKEKYTIRKNLSQERVFFYFDHEIRYYLLYNNRHYAVKNKGSFSKLFPQYKKQINQFVKDNKLNFKHNPIESLTALAVYCEELTGWE